MNRILKKVLVGILTASMLVTVAPVVSQATTITKGRFDFSQMTVRRVWFNTNDPVFLIDNYNRVWLDENVNVLATGNYATITSAGDLMAPMKEMFKQIGVDYSESGNDITITMNGETLRLTIGSNDVVFNGNTLIDALSAAQIPKSVNAKTEYAAANTFLTQDYYVTYLPVAYILNKFGADIYLDSNIKSFYAAIPVINTSVTPSYSTAAQGYGSRYDGLLLETLTSDTAIADNIVALQNADGGFASLPSNMDMTQSDIVNKLGSLRDTSTLIDGATTAELKYLAKYITETNPADSKYQDVFKKGIQFLTDNQHATGAWQMSPTAAVGFNGNLEVGNGSTIAVLGLLSDVAVLNNQNYVFARKIVNVDIVKAAVLKGNDFLISTQMSNDGVKAGWASQYKADGTVTMGRTYERESVSSFTTKAVAQYLMTIHDPSVLVQEAINTSVTWLNSVKIVGKEVKSVADTSMNNGFDVYLVDGAGTWASNYAYDAATKLYKPLYSDVDPSRANQPYVNMYELKGINTTNDLILYATRTTISYYDNDLAVELSGSEFTNWKSYLSNGFPAIPTDPNVGDNTGTGSNPVITVPAGQVVDSSVFETIKANGSTVQINVTDPNGNIIASWAFDGNTINSFTPVALGVVINATSTNAQKLIDKANVANKSVVIHFDYSGELPGPAKVKVNVQDKFANGTQVKLYYFNESSGKLEFQNQIITVADGSAEFTITHCSDYVLSDVSLGDTLDNVKLPQTGDHTNIWLYIIIGVGALCMVGGLFVYNGMKKKTTTDK
ncbi:pectate lyase [[Clostridium] fimetarium]|uniref:Pectate lyase, PelA/Pel-15E family n=1 Tax=[Clostridium] fimetarium TaxID=99656 RepID=A0A1I0P1F2_9FIRM|nr:pectate lyase [[Clostridium] fimetarium]SEW07949.1 pectate lyase, PelA/Pel-15E family [[Clostridium] fimetarium]